LIALVAIGWFIARARPFAADRPPGRVEAFVASRLVRLSIPASQRAAANPFAGDAAVWRDAVDHFGEHCVACHGTDGRGQSAFGRMMYPPVPDLTSAAIQQFSDGELFAVISHGVRWTGMPAFRSTDTDEEIWKLVSLIRRLPSLMSNSRGCAGSGVRLLRRVRSSAATFGGLYASNPTGALVRSC
jgi:mono/diheme cytochrome c family protein